MLGPPLPAPAPKGLGPLVVTFGLVGGRGCGCDVSKPPVLVLGLPLPLPDPKGFGGLVAEAPKPEPDPDAKGLGGFRGTIVFPSPVTAGGTGTGDAKACVRSVGGFGGKG